MPITVTFDLNSATTDGNDRTRIRLAFHRFGWETIGGTAYRYPPLNAAAAAQPPEDWFNHVVPALMYMRTLIESRAIQIDNFTIDASSSTGWRHGVGPGIADTQTMSLVPVTGSDDAILSDSRLRTWLHDVKDAI
jgi:hypothetical protein